jgi:D-alanyl-D-alanine dipeptidase
VSDRIQTSEGQHDTGATLDLAFRKGDGLLVVIATQNEHNLTREIL